MFNRKILNVKFDKISIRSRKVTYFLLEVPTNKKAEKIFFFCARRAN